MVRHAAQFCGDGVDDRGETSHAHLQFQTGLKARRYFAQPGLMIAL